MPFVTVNETQLFYQLEGEHDLPVLVLSHSLGCDLSMWEPQMSGLLKHVQVLRYDTRGHGASDAPVGDYTMDQLGHDVLGLADALNIPKFAFCGLSMGGAIGQWLAIHVPERISSLILASTSAQFASPDAWETRRRTVREGGMQALVDMAMQRFFSPGMQSSATAQKVRLVFLKTKPEGYAACCAALRDVDNKLLLAKITAPTLVIGGDQDPSTPWADHGAILARDIPGAKAVVLAAAHLSNLGQPEAFTSAMVDFLLPPSRSVRA